MILKLNNTSVVVFDLDDTLYNEIDFVKSAFHYIAKKYCSSTLDKSYSELLIWFNNNEDVFDKFIAHHDLSHIGLTKVDLISEYRYHIPNIQLRDDANILIENLKEYDIKLGLITDGRSITQRNKINALGLDEKLDLIIVSEEIGSEKPSLKNYLYFNEKYPKSDFHYIADNPKKDFVTPNKLGWSTICYLDTGTNIHKQSFDIDLNFKPIYSIRNFNEIVIEWTK